MTDARCADMFGEQAARGVDGRASSNVVAIVVTASLAACRHTQGEPTLYLRRLLKSKPAGRV
jgi:hypothetical protein